MTRVFISLLTFVMVFSSNFVAFAQTSTTTPSEEAPQAPVEDLPTGRLKCSGYYDFGSVQADISTTVSDTVPGGTLTFSGTISNSNNYPLIDGTLYVKIFKKNKATYDDYDGNIVVDQFVVQDEIILAGKENKKTNFNWKVPNNAEEGEYYAAFFYTTSKRYNLLGLSFSDDVVGNQAPFTVSTESQSKVAKLDKTSTTLNNLDHNFTAYPLHFTAEETVVVRTTITNPSNTAKTLPLQWNQYAWDSMNEDNRRNTKTEVVTLQPNETKTVTYEIVPQRESVVYVTAISQDGESKSILNIRYVRDGVPETRINFPGIAAFPLAKDSENTLFACAHSTNVLLVPGNTLTLTLTDRDGGLIHEFRYQGDIRGSMGGYGEKFSVAKNYNYALLTAKLEREGVVIEEVKIMYDCKAIDPNSCLPEEASITSTFDVVKEHIMTIILGLSILVLIIALILYFKRHRKVRIDSSALSLLFVSLIIPCLFFSTLNTAEAKSVVGDGAVAIDYIYKSSPGGSCNISGTTDFNMGDEISYLVSAEYIVNAYNNSTNALITENTTVPQGTEVRFDVILENSQTSWFEDGRSYDSPNGFWVDNFPAQPIDCMYGDIPGPPVHNVYFKRPVINFNHTGSSATFSCNANGSLCTVTSAGTLATSIDFSPGQFIAHGKGLSMLYPKPPSFWGGAGGIGFSIPALTYPIQVAPPANNPPSTPNVTGATTGNPNVNYPFNFTGTDPDGDTLRYGIDWDSNGSIDEWVPGSGYVSSGSQQTSSRSWLGAGTYTFQVLAQDSKGASSGWASHSITLTPAVISSDLTINGSNGPLSVVKGSALTIAWTSSNAASCTKFGANWGSGQGVALSGSENVAATISDTYLINCSGVIDSVSVTVVNQPPNAPTISGPTSANGGDNNNYTISATDPDGDQIFYEIDWDNNGSVDVSSPGAGYINSGTGVGASRTWLAAGSYTFQARTVDTVNARSGWTQHNITINNSVSATASLEAQINGGAWSTADQTVNPSDTVVLRWTSNYASSCTASGPGFTAGGTSGTDTVSTPAPNSNSLFSVNCSGGTDSITITTRELPNLTQPSVFTPAMGTFDTVTGMYNGMSVSFRTDNNGGSDTPNEVDYHFEVDLNNDGSFETDITRTNGISVLGVGSGTNETENVAGSIPIGTHRIRITVDSSGNPGKVTETNESDNVFNDTITVPAANPGLSINVNPDRIQNGQNVTIVWNATAPYSMNCSVFGPGMTTKNFNLMTAVPSDNNIAAGPLTAKSEYTIRCNAGGTVFSATDTVETQGVIEEI